ncbi:glycosyltransferase [Amorphoplanes nipponensis]|uniref:Glycosyl transferase family 1 n=1 Tax=Actinoplanes nipponensis TaxID=135950 RepID=A0A919MMJ2_9ACTN|nr:glycosyltransferase [Actinoplanes nipponensis]GIE47478.1 glycosyl transferase family 1 [Actinoplanes nipponensis]
MVLVHVVPSSRRPVSRLETVIEAERYARLRTTADGFRRRFAGRTIWNVNSTAVGGGVAEMLQGLVGYVEDLGIAIRWLVIHGDADFFSITKRLHNAVHGHGDPAGLDAAAAHHYTHVLTANAVELLDHVRPGDIALLHDPQTAGLAAPLAEAGATVVWRCHIGADRQTGVTEAAWEFLRPFLSAAHGWVFSRRAYAPDWLDPGRVWVVPPSIDPFSTKNADLDADTVRTVLATIGVLDVPPAGPPARFGRRDGTVGEVVRPAAVVADGLPGPDDELVVQVSRWDRLKDMTGVMRGFADHVADHRPRYLALVGPAVTNVADDPEGATVYADCLLQWRALPPAARARTLLVTLPLDDTDENATMVNALQRHASVVTQKSLAEGFGLTVAEAMWKGRPVVGSAVGGITDQIAAGTGVLLDDPTDLAAFGATVRHLLDHPEERARLGAAAHDYVRANFVGDLHLLRYAEVFGALAPVGPAAR